MRELLGHEFLIEHTALKGGLVLNERSNHLVQILLTDARGFLALGFGEPFDLDLEMPGPFVKADITFVGVIAAFAVIETGARSALGVLRFELKARRKHLFHKQACRDSLQGIVHRLSDCFFGSVRLGNQVREPRAGLARRVAGRTPYNLDDFC